MEGKERCNQQYGQSALLEDTNYDLTSNESRNVLNGFLLKLRDISSNYILNCSIHSRLSSYQVVVFFLSSISLKTLASSYRKMYHEARK